MKIRKIRGHEKQVLETTHCPLKTLPLALCQLGNAPSSCDPEVEKWMDIDVYIAGL